jgi:hypothetical protein
MNTDTPILAIDPGKYESVACLYDHTQTTFTTVRTTQEEIDQLLSRQLHLRFAHSGFAPATYSCFCLSHRILRFTTSSFRRCQETSMSRS